MDSRTINDVKVDYRMNELRLIEMIVELIMAEIEEQDFEPTLLYRKDLDDIISLSKRLASVFQTHTIEFNTAYTNPTYCIWLNDKISEYKIADAAIDIGHAMSSIYSASTTDAFAKYRKLCYVRNKNFVEKAIKEYFSGIIFYDELCTFGVFDKLSQNLKHDIFELLKYKDCTSDEERMNKVMLWKLSKE